MHHTLPEPALPFVIWSVLAMLFAKKPWLEDEDEPFGVWLDTEGGAGGGGEFGLSMVTSLLFRRRITKVRYYKLANAINLERAIDLEHKTKGFRYNKAHSPFFFPWKHDVVSVPINASTTLLHTAWTRIQELEPGMKFQPTGRVTLGRNWLFPTQDSVPIG